MTTLELKAQYSKMAKVYNRNLKHIKVQLSSQGIQSMMKQYNANSDSHLAKILMLRGIEL